MNLQASVSKLMDPRLRGGDGFFIRFFMKDQLVCMAEIVGVHGIKGMVKLKVFSDAPESLPDYAPLCDEKGAPSH